ncbi:hypothetical protein C8R44DRAFT_738138 [Mycena epipterygia]|nr:hypothetical protein C8R44DRAFT_738138 [Mycena epipterygia]
MSGQTSWICATRWLMRGPLYGTTESVSQDAKPEKVHAVLLGTSGKVESSQATVLLHSSPETNEKTILQHVDNKLELMEKSMAQHLDKVTTTHHKEMAEIKEYLYSDEEPIPGYGSRADEVQTLKAQKEALRQFLLRKQNTSSRENSVDNEQAKTSTALCQAMETMGKMQLYINNRCNNTYLNNRYNNSSYPQKTAKAAPPNEKSAKASGKPAKAGHRPDPDIEAEKSAGKADKPEKSKHRQRATVEEIDDSEEEDDLRPARNELPFKDVPPVEHVLPGESAPRKPASRNTGGRPVENLEKAYEVRRELDDPEALVETLKQILDQLVLVKLKYLLGISPALQKGMKSKTSKSRKYQSKQGLDGSLLAPKVQNFTVQMVKTTEEETPWSRRTLVHTTWILNS